VWFRVTPTGLADGLGLGLSLGKHCQCAPTKRVPRIPHLRDFGQTPPYAGVVRLSNRRERTRDESESVALAEDGSIDVS